MTRRNLLRSGAAAAVAGAAANAQSTGGQRRIIDLTTYKLRNSLKNERAILTDYLKDGLAPALERAGVTPAGFFSSFIAPDGPYFSVVTSFASMADWEATRGKVTSDRKYQDALTSYSKAIAQSPVRMERTLLRAFPSVPKIEVPPAAKESNRVFELRTYESNTLLTLGAKIKMFDDGEVSIFRRAGINPVFFGETIAGTNMPNLTYLVWYDDWAARDKAWAKFLADPEWIKLRATPGLSDGEVVSNISNMLWKGLPFSAIR